MTEIVKSAFKSTLLGNLPNGTYTASVTSFDGSENFGSFSVTVRGETAVFPSSSDPKTKVKATIITGGFPGEKEITVTGETQPACYKNYAYLDETVILKSANSTTVEGQEITAPISLPSGANLSVYGSINPWLMYRPNGAFDYLNSGEYAEDIINYVADGVNHKQSIFIFPSACVGDNLATSNELKQSIGLEDGEVYEVAFSLKGTPSTPYKVSLDGDTTVTSKLSLAVEGREVFTLRAPANCSTLNILGSGSEVSEVSVRKILRDDTVADVNRFSVTGGTGEAEMKWFVRPKKWMLDEVHFNTTVGMLSDGLWARDWDGHTYMRYDRDIKQSFYPQSPVTLSKNQSWAVEIRVKGILGAPTVLASRELNAGQVAEDWPGSTKIAFWGDGKSTVIDNSATRVDPLDFDSNSTDWMIRRIEYDGAGGIEAFIDGVSQGTNTGVTGDILMEKLFFSDYPESDFLFDYMEVEINGAVAHRWETSTFKDADKPATLLDSVGGNHAVGLRAPVNIYNEYAIEDTECSENLAFVDIHSYDRELDIIRNPVSKSNPITGHTLFDNCYFEGNGGNTKTAAMIAIGNNDFKIKGNIYFYGVSGDLELSSNKSIYANNNNDGIRIDTTSPDFSEFYTVTAMGDGIKNVSDGCKDIKLTSFTNHQHEQGGLFCQRQHTSYGVIANSHYERYADSKAAIQCTYKYSGYTLYNFYVDGVRALSSEQLQAQKKVNGTYATDQGALEKTPDGETNFDLQFHVSKTKPYLPPEADFHMTDMELEYSDNEGSTWKSLALDDYDLQGVVGSPQRVVSLPSGVYDFRLRCKNGAIDGKWNTVTNVEVL